MPDASKQILEKMLERLYSALLQGPSLNSRPHNSRQRVDLAALHCFQHTPPADIISNLLTSDSKVEILAKVPPFRGSLDEQKLSEAERAAKRAFEAQSRLLAKLKTIIEDAVDYEQETGENALYIGYPLLSVPPGAEVMGNSSARILAPVALIPVEMSIKGGTTPSLALKAKGEGADLLVANFPLLAWLEQQTAQDTSNLFLDEEGGQPYREINGILEVLAKALQAPIPPAVTEHTPLDSLPRTEQLPAGLTFLNCAVLGLFPVSNQGLLRDTKALLHGEPVLGPLERFLQTRLTPAPLPATEPTATLQKQARSFQLERLVCPSDPCQTRATIVARESPVLVVHGPPGTGKSQTITNIIGDHLARGERVLMVCDKRTALDVVHHRLEFLGLAELCAVVHDAQRDQRGLYMQIRDSLENLVERKTNAQAATELFRVDEELNKLHQELTSYFSALSEPPTTGQKSFHTLVGEWFGLQSIPHLTLPGDALEGASLSDFEAAQNAVTEILDRALKVDYPHNPWVEAAGVKLEDFLSNSAAFYLGRLHQLVQNASAADDTLTSNPLPLVNTPLGAQAEALEKLAQILAEFENLPIDARSFWAPKSAQLISSTLDQLKALGSSLDLIASAALAPECVSVISGNFPNLGEVNVNLSVLQEYEEIAGKWYGGLFNKRKSAAGRIAASFGMQISPESSGRLRTFFEGLKARLVCQDFCHRMLKPAPAATSLLPASSNWVWIK